MIPNKHCDISDGLSSSNIRLVMFGVQRSGSSWLWQMLGDLLVDGVMKTHRRIYIPGVPVVAIHRDFRDVIVSHWRTWKPHAEFMSIADIYLHVGQMHEWTFALRSYSDNNATIVRYDELLNDPRSTLTSILASIGVSSTPEKINSVVASHTLEINKRISDSLSEPDLTRMLVPGHCHEGEIGCFARFLHPPERNLLEQLLESDLRQFGYQ